MDKSAFCSRLKYIKGRIERAANKAGTAPEGIHLVLVTKTRSIDSILLAAECGVTDVGENYVQEAVEKYYAIGDRLNWHFIGHLQRNKVKQVVQFAKLIHSVDSIALAKEIAKRSLQAQKTMDVLLEINVTGEQRKTGADLDDAGALIEAACTMEGIRVCGLMGMARLSESPEEARPYFSKLKTLYETLPQEHRMFLSMGMTQDFEIAIEEGSNMVRIGRAVFDPVV